MNKEDLIAWAIIGGKALVLGILLELERRLGKTTYGSILGFMLNLLLRRPMAKESVMEKDLLDGKLGEVGTYELDLVNGMLVVKGGTNPSDIGYAKAEVGVNALAGVKAVVKKIEDAIPGEYDNLVLEAFLKYAEEALKK